MKDNGDPEESFLPIGTVPPSLAFPCAACVVCFADNSQNAKVGARKNLTSMVSHATNEPAEFNPAADSVQPPDGVNTSMSHNCAFFRHPGSLRVSERNSSTLFRVAPREASPLSSPHKGNTNISFERELRSS